MKKVQKSFLLFAVSMLVFAGMTFSQGVTCTHIYGVYLYGGWHVDYWCCSGPQGCFYDVYQEE